MSKIAIIGSGAIAGAVSQYLTEQDVVEIAVALVEPGMESRARETFGSGVEIVSTVAEIASEVDVAADCAGHPALRQHGAAILQRGIDLISVSSGALADSVLYDELATAARSGDAKLRIVSGAIGALDVLSASSIGSLERVVYRGRKPANGWRGSAAETKIDLDALTGPTVHFEGSARVAALEYPKNANVAASVALAGIGFDKTVVELIADPGVDRNVHEIVAEGDFGRCEFRIEGNSLPDNPRSSAITAMSVVRELLNPASPIVI